MIILRRRSGSNPWPTDSKTAKSTRASVRPLAWTHGRTRASVRPQAETHAGRTDARVRPCVHRLRRTQDARTHAGRTDARVRPCVQWLGRTYDALLLPLKFRGVRLSAHPIETASMATLLVSVQGAPLYYMKVYLILVITNSWKSTSFIVWQEMKWTPTPSSIDTPSSIEIQRCSLVSLYNTNG